MATRLAVYTGEFDPIHYGHLDVIQRGSRLVDRLIVGVGDNPAKDPLFNQDERVELCKLVVASLPNVEVKPFSGLAVRFVREVGSRIILRGIRTTSDMELEFTMSLTNLALDSEIETVFLMANETYSFISSRLVKEVARLGGSVSGLVPPSVEARLERRLSGSKLRISQSKIREA